LHVGRGLLYVQEKRVCREGVWLDIDNEEFESKQGGIIDIEARGSEILAVLRLS
jgi:hypothetical protein